MRPLAALLAVAASLVVATTPEPPRRGSLDDLRSNAVYHLEESDGVRRVERLVAVDRPKHRIIHIADVHFVSFDDLARDLRDEYGTVSDTEIRAEWGLWLQTIMAVQKKQRELIRWLATYHGVSRVFCEGLTDADKPAYDEIIRDARNFDVDLEDLLRIGAAGRALVMGQLDAVEPAEDEVAYRRADPFAAGAVTFDGPANDDRERAIVERLIASGPLSVVVLGAAHDLSRHLPPGTEYLRVFVDGFPPLGDAAESR
jgi:hypothetical protein